MRILGLVFVIAGTLGLVYGGFSYTRDRHDVKFGPVEFSVKQEERINVPVWAGVGAIAIGALLMLAGGRKK